MLHRKSDYMSNIYTLLSYVKITRPISKCNLRRQNLSFTYSGVTSSLAIDIPWRQECQIHIPASASSDATDVNGNADDLVCRRPFLHREENEFTSLLSIWWQKSRIQSLLSFTHHFFHSSMFSYLTAIINKLFNVNSI